ncbi:DUF3352 domain-containing protein [Flavivirga aquatica]|uniref:DUF3352 domain-containing protein n=1 Tax=Flavivirga aquatica TaxID=1849968 RepID=A0A1E5TB78_9FLAO|nr:DUF3352 domain-containing protein [Flavivirga aquatica]OEK08634.1 DUF3352 domain-containing protein [Flavivirga aquatica]
MKKRNILYLLLTLIIGFILYQLCVFYFDNNDNIQSIYLVPKDAVYLIETQEPVDNWEAISKSDIWKHLNSNTYFNELAESLNKLDTIFKEKQGLFDKIGDREILVSAHVYAPQKYDFFYVVDLQKIAKLDLLKNHLNTLVDSNFKVSKRKYHEHEITEIHDIKTRETLYISFIKNQLIASYVHTLVEASIDQYLEPDLGRNFDFIEVRKHVGYDDMFRLYFQYKYLEDFIKIFSNDTGYIGKSLSESFDFSGFSFDLDDNTILANGVTNTNNQANTYLQALQESGKSSRSISEIAPKQTALYLSFAFNSFDDFYTNFETILKENPEQFKSYLDGTEQIENFLKIDLKEHFMSWIDDEVALLQLHSSVSQSKKDVAFVLKTKNNEDAKQNLDFILEQIRKRSPVKFKEVNYKGYPINFMSIKGFFKLLLGGLFKSIDKPYFTIIEDYVVFSNHPNTLKSIINTYISSETLDNFDAYTDFDDKFDNQSSVFAYINMPNLYNSTYQFVNATTKKQVKANKDYLICFPQIGIQLTPEKDYFESKIIVDYEDPEVVKAKYAITDKTISNKTSKNTKPIEVTEDNINKKTVFNIPEIYPSDLTAKTFTRKYANGTIRFSVELKDGLKHGRYNEYYPNGTLKISGKYANDKQVKTWSVYNYQEDLVYKKRF